LTERDESEQKPDIVSPFDKRAAITTIAITTIKEKIVRNNITFARATVDSRFFATLKTGRSPKSFRERRKKKTGRKKEHHLLMRRVRANNT
jgi:hypothetical protein